MDRKTFFALPGADQLAPGDMMPIDLPGGRCIAVYNVEGTLYATDDRCSHGNASLADGDLEGFRIICPFHEGAFDIRDGSPAGYPCTVPVKSYAVISQDGVTGLFIAEDEHDQD